MQRKHSSREPCSSSLPPPHPHSMRSPPPRTACSCLHAFAFRDLREPEQSAIVRGQVLENSNLIYPRPPEGASQSPGTGEELKTNLETVGSEVLPQLLARRSCRAPPAAPSCQHVSRPLTAELHCRGAITRRPRGDARPNAVDT